jgi:cytochrome c-type biogenesis protein CcmE
MNRKIKFTVSGIAIIGAMALLFYIGIGKEGSLVYYLTVSEYIERGAPEEENFRINGKVLDGSIERDTLGMKLKFQITDGAAALPVNYDGAVPDMFTDGADVVVEGKKAADGTFKAHTLLTKCPSKYEAAGKEGVANN